MDTLEDNHEQDFYLFMKDNETRKKERERLKMLPYEERMAALGDLNADEANENNQLALVPMHDYGDAIDFTDAAMGETLANFNPEIHGGDITAHIRKSQRSKADKRNEEPEELSIAE